MPETDLNTRQDEPCQTEKLAESEVAANPERKIRTRAKEVENNEITIPNLPSSSSSKIVETNTGEWWNVLGQKRPLTPDDHGQPNGQKKSPIRKGLTMLQQIRLARQKAEEQKKKDEEEAEAAIRQIEDEKRKVEEAKKAAEQKIVQEKLDRIRRKRLRLSAAASVGRIS